MIYQLLWIFYTYSFFGWLAETIYGAVRLKRFVNRGFLNGPLCVIYGIAGVLCSVGLRDQQNNLFWLFVGGVIYTTVLEWFAGHLLERFGLGRWWDYSGIKGNKDGYICIPFSLLWGILVCISIRWFNPSLVMVARQIPHTIELIFLWTASGITAVDFLGSVLIATKHEQLVKSISRANARIDKNTIRFGNFIANRFMERTEKAHPTTSRYHVFAKTENPFGEGLSFHKLILIFLIGGIAGDIVETIFCYVKMGIWMSRSSLVFGQLSIVWGGAIALATMLLYRSKERSDGYIFFIGTVLGAAYEYGCSVLSETILGAVFWDYSNIPFNLDGRINLLYSFFWGIAAVVWIKYAYPFLSRMIAKIPARSGKWIASILLVLFLLDLLLSGLAYGRYMARQEGLAPANQLEQTLDTYFPDEKILQVYPMGKPVEK